MSSAGSTPSLLRRDIKSLSAAFLVLNGVIGAGIYALPAALAQSAGAFSPWLILATGILVIAIVLTFSALASYFRDSGGPVLYAGTAFGPMAGFQTGWLLYLGRVTSLAANTNVLIFYAVFLWPQIGGGWPRAALITLLFSAMIGVNISGVGKTIGAISVLTVLKVAPLLILIALGLPHLSAETLLPGGLPGIDDVGGTALLLMYAFIGFENASMTAGETASPRRHLPRVLIATVALVCLIYFLIQLTYVAVVTEAVGDGAPLIEMARLLAGPVGAIVITCTAIFSVGGNLTASMMTAPRMTFALARAGSLPAWFGRVHPRFQTPDRSILFLGAVACLLAVTGSFLWLAIISSLARMIAYATCIAALPVIRKRASEDMKTHAVRLPGGYAIPALGLALCLWAASQSPAGTWALLLALMALGMVLFRASRGKAGRENLRH